ncbi:hypothetical protein BD413DRAFT_552038 [Trametes elegans]|nr:hypothetical protein BD413DRAFT_552038 [Trametes elegans]
MTIHLVKFPRQPELLAILFPSPHLTHLTLVTIHCHGDGDIHQAVTTLLELRSQSVCPALEQMSLNVAQSRMPLDWLLDVLVSRSRKRHLLRAPTVRCVFPDSNRREWLRKTRKNLAAFLLGDLMGISCICTAAARGINPSLAQVRFPGGDGYTFT